MFIVLYVDDILLMSPPFCMLDKWVRIHEHELDQIDMVINVKISCWLRIGQRNDFYVMPFEPPIELLFRGLMN